MLGGTRIRLRGAWVSREGGRDDAATVAGVVRRRCGCSVRRGHSGDPPRRTTRARRRWCRIFHDHLTVTRVASLILAIAGVLVVLFAARLRELLQSGEPGGDLLSVAAFGGTVILAAGS